LNLLEQLYVIENQRLIIKNQGYIMKITLSILTMISVFLLYACSTSKQTTKTTDDAGNIITTPSGLKYQELVTGRGSNPRYGQKVTLHYIIKTESGDLIEDSYKMNQPMTFILGNNEVIQGIEEGVVTMKPGGKRRLYIPPELGFGGRKIRNIPANSNLIFEIELIKSE